MRPRRDRPKPTDVLDSTTPSTEHAERRSGQHERSLDELREPGLGDQLTCGGERRCAHVQRRERDYRPCRRQLMRRLVMGASRGWLLATVLCLTSAAAAKPFTPSSDAQLLAEVPPGSAHVATRTLQL